MAIQSCKRGASEDELPEGKRCKPAAAAHQSALRVHRAVAERGLLSVSWVELPKDWGVVAKLAYGWSGEAYDLKKNACDPFEEELFDASFGINLNISNEGKKIFEDPLAYRVGVCMGGGQKQGIMVAKVNRPQEKRGRRRPPNVKIEFLATRPGNLCRDVEERFSGVGRSLVEHAKSLAREQRISYVVLMATSQARGFYERCGFVPISHVWEKYDVYDLGGGDMATFVEPLTGI